MKDTRGITLISLIVTIIILLILAGVVLNLTLQRNGIFTTAKQAGKNYINTQEQELADLENLYSSMQVAINDDAKITISMEDLNKLIEDKIKNSITGPDYNKRESITFTNKSYTVQEDGYIQVYFKYLSGVNAGSGVQDFLRINNVIVFANNASVNWQNPWSPIFHVKKGDLISYSATAQEITGFYFPIR